MYLPIDIVNYICEFARDNTTLWYPFFSPKTSKVTWKVNPYCTKYITLSKKFLNPTLMYSLTFYNVNTLEEIETPCKIAVFNQDEHYHYIKKIYIEIDSDHDNRGKFMIRGMLMVINKNMVTDDFIYLNGTDYAVIRFGYIRDIYRITIGYETF